MLAALPNYLMFLGASIVFVGLGIAVYSAITPMREISLIRDGNMAAALSLGGTAIGLAIAVHAVASTSYQILDMAAWSGIAVASQLVAFVIASLCVPGLRHGIEEGQAAHGALLGALSIAMGVLNAGALST